ncbi:accessory gene regulator AgrB [Staphylococcus felis]|uniref:Accessory gene regulator protein B n=2 Tax=Staphylococcus felis TaxID=46127 RepID=A0ABS0QNF9_9STAP|nr:accessory gene regulator AgrB [Staphylococcus felis]MBH9580566.1 accessory gene regulator AgrB [Staphylococcus felis]MDM8328629.1 accessory gene regulator AgrB [Staphylococcus felis]REI07551.1 accessory regulator AgrB [Staphylococcus felis]
MRIIDQAIEQLALKLKEKQHLDHIEFLKVRLGMQVVAINFFKGIVTYGLALLLNIFLYTLTVHISYFVLRYFSHGAHAKSSLLCHIQNIVFFVIIPFLINYYDITFSYMLFLTIIGLIVVIRYAPAATRKQPIKSSRKKGLKLKSIVVIITLIVISIFIPQPYQQLICYGLVLQAGTLLPIFFPKEES